MPCRSLVIAAAVAALVVAAGFVAPSRQQELPSATDRQATIPDEELAATQAPRDRNGVSDREPGSVNQGPEAAGHTKSGITVWISRHARRAEDGLYVYHYFEDCFHLRSDPQGADEGELVRTNVYRPCKDCVRRLETEP
jgi:hypothetical protein